MKKKVLLPVLLAALAFPLALSQKPSALSAEFIGEFGAKGSSDRSEYIAHATKVNGQLADEGFVLLKNDGFLPMNGDEMVSIVGKSSTNLARGGAGSGSGSTSSGVSEITLKKSLTDVGFSVNPTTDSFYGSSRSGSGRTNGNSSWSGNSEVTIGETDIQKVISEEGLLDSFSEYGDCAIQVLTREGSEGCDVKTCNAHDSQKTNNSSKAISDKHALELSDNEQALFDLLHEHFDHIIIVINSSNIFECDVFQKDPKVSGVLWIGNPGDVGPGAVGRILAGEVNPSGRTVDTWGRDFTKDPTFQNFSDNAQTNIVEIGDDKYYVPADTMLNADGTPTRSYGTRKSYTNTASPSWDNNRSAGDEKVVSGGINGVKPSAYVSYEEDIYLDYRYYETRYADMAKSNKAAADEWYNSEDGVVYPFGYGLSYTTFDQKILRVNPSKGSTLNAQTDLIEVTVKVTNTGKVAGKDAIQLYWRAPYTAGGIEKADHVLCAFDKTDEIQPGQSQTMTLTFHLQDVANYDAFDKNNNQFQGYELDGGEYELMLNKNAHESYGYVKFNIANGGIQYENDRITGNKVENRFTDRKYYNSMPQDGNLEFTQMSRENFERTFPTHPTKEDRTLSADSYFETFLTHEFKLAEYEKGNEYDIIPEAAHKTKQDFIDNHWEQKSVASSARLQLSAYKDVLYTDDAEWDKLLNELTWDEMYNVIGGSTRQTPGVSAIGKGGYSEGDGPQKFDIMWWVSSPIIAATFNPRLAHEQGECCGMEAHITGKDGWWGPAVNTHRSPFGGRNFEYYAADPYLMGRIATEVVGAATDKGIYCYFKHFAVNDQEKNRESGISFVSEQALREIYLRPFQMVFEEGKSIGVMGSYNRIGLIEAAGHYGLMTEVLRDEWGFEGCVLSDMAHPGNGDVNFNCYESVNQRVLAGNNTQLATGGDGNFKSKVDAQWSSSAFDGKGGVVVKSDTSVEAYSFWYACRQMLKGYLYMAVHSTGFDGNLTKVSKVENLTYKIGENFSYNFNVANATGYRLNDRIVLPAGVTLENGVLSGAIAKAGLYRIDVMADGATKGAVQLIINVVPDEAEYDENLMERYPEESSNPEPEQPKKKKGCFGDIASVGALIGLISIAGLGLILVSYDRKRRAR